MVWRDKLTPLARRRAHSRVLYGYIVKSKPGLLRELVETAREFELPTLVKRERILLDALREMIPFGGLGLGLRVFPRFNMVAGIFPREVIFDMAEWRAVEKIYSDEPVYAFIFPTVPPEGIFRYRRKIKKPIDFTTTYYVKKLMGADIANQKGFTGQRMRVGIVDTGSRRTHEQVSGRIEFKSVLKGQYADMNGHGTWVATCIGGRLAVDDRLSRQIGRTIYCEGFAPNCYMVSVKTLGYAIGTGSTSGIIEAIQMLLEYGVDAINLSLGGECKYRRPEEDPMYDVFNEVNMEGVIPVVAAGNEGPEPNTVATPGWLPNVLTVGAIDPIKGTVADFSSRGPTNDNRVKPDCVGYGVNIHSGIAGQLDYAGDNVENRYSPISGTCLVGDTPILTPNGPIELSKIEVGDEVYSFADGKIVTAKVTNKWDRGVKTIYRVYSYLLGEIYATANHPFLCLTKYGRGKYRLRWIPTASLTPNSVVIGVKKLPENIAPELDSLINEELAKLLGWFTADGWIARNKRNWQLCLSESDGADEISSILRGITNSEIRHNTDAKWRYLYSRRLGLALSLLGFGQRHNNMALPKWLYHISRRKMKAFIEGFLVGDGDKKRRIEIASKWLARDLRALCLYAGIECSRIWHRKREIKPPNGKLRQWETWSLGIGLKEPKTSTHMLGLRIIPKCIKDLLDYDTFRLCKITKVEHIGEERVYDIEVSGTNNFIADGFVVHNSMATPTVTGLITLMREAIREFAPWMKFDLEDVFDMLQYTAIEEKNNDYGWGLITWQRFEEWLESKHGVRI